MHRPLILSVLVLGLLPVGCATAPPDGGPPPQWSYSGRDATLVPVLPPREDVRVGDLFVYDHKPGPVTAAAPRYAAIPVTAALDEEYRDRRPFPATPDEFMQVSPAPENRTMIEARSDAEVSIFSPATTTSRLRLVDLNAISAMTFEEGDLNALIPTEAVNLTMGTAWLDKKAVMIRLNAAESYALSLERLLPLVVRTEVVDTVDPADPAYDGEPSERYVLQDAYRNFLDLLARPDEETVWVQVVSEVFYVRGVDISIQSRAGSRDDDELHASELGEIDDDGEDADSPAPIAAAVPDDPELDPAYGAFRRAQAINELLIGADLDDVPGGFIRFISVTDESVSMRRIWQRGLAVTIRPITLEVEVRTGVVRSLVRVGE